MNFIEKFSDTDEIIFGKDFVDVAYSKQFILELLRNKYLA